MCQEKLFGLYFIQVNTRNCHVNYYTISPSEGCVMVFIMAKFIKIILLLIEIENKLCYIINYLPPVFFNWNTQNITCYINDKYK